MNVKTYQLNVLHKKNNVKNILDKLENFKLFYKSSLDNTMTCVTG